MSHIVVVVIAVVVVVVVVFAASPQFLPSYAREERERESLLARAREVVEAQLERRSTQLEEEKG